MVGEKKTLRVNHFFLTCALPSPHCTDAALAHDSTTLSSQGHHDLDKRR